jgi:hypothetical protein
MPWKGPKTPTIRSHLALDKRGIVRDHGKTFELIAGDQVVGRLLTWSCRKNSCVGDECTRISNHTVAAAVNTINSPQSGTSPGDATGRPPTEMIAVTASTIRYGTLVRPNRGNQNAALYVVLPLTTTVITYAA